MLYVLSPFTSAVVCDFVSSTFYPLFFFFFRALENCQVELLNATEGKKKIKNKTKRYSDLRVVASASWQDLVQSFSNPLNAKVLSINPAFLALTFLS